MSELGKIMEIERDLQKEGIAPRGSLHLHNVMAKFTLEQDLGLRDSVKIDYGIDNQTRDRLIVHTRQDASLAVYTANAAEKLGIKNRRLLIIVLLLQCLLIWRTW